MLQQIENKIQELKQLRAEEYYKKKDEDLKSWGLTTKTDGKKVVPIIVTDDEYEELVKASNGVGKVGRNSVAILLNILSYAILVVGGAAGYAISRFTDGIGIVSITSSIIVAAIVAVLFRGIAEAIRLLQQIIDSKPIERPDPLIARRPDIRPQEAQPTMQQMPMQPGYYTPYPPQQAPQQGQAYAYPYPYPQQMPPQQPPVQQAKPVKSVVIEEELAKKEAPIEPNPYNYNRENLEAFYNN